MLGNGHLTTGQFARLMGTSKDTLFHYDRLGIFSPILKTDNGYRFYSVNQMDVFKVISLLRDLGMSLKEIKDYLDKRSPDELITLLDKKETLLDEKIKQLQKMKNTIAIKKEMTKVATQINPSQIIVEEFKEDLLVITKADAYISDKSIYDSMIKHEKYLASFNIHSTHTIGWMRDSKKVFANETFNYDFLYTRVNQRSSYSNFKREAGFYLSAYHSTGYSTINDSYDRIIRYVTDKEIAVQGYFYEDVLLDDLSVKGYEKFLIKISIQIKNNKQ